MKIDVILEFGDPGLTGEAARRAEADAYDGVWSAETDHDPFLPLAIAAEHTERVDLGTSITVALPRNPMHLAYAANDLQLYSRGRFILGLGSQVKAHIEGRFGTPWSQPAARMRELILAMRAIWTSWNERTRLDFRGEFYRHTLMTPPFDPGPNPYGAPKVFLAAVGERMTAVAAEMCDGIIVHGFTTARYLREVTLPALQLGFEEAGDGASRAAFQVSCPVMVVTGSSDRQLEESRARVRGQIAFYGSTPAYRPVLDLHGWGDLQPELRALSKQGRWTEMAALIEDEVLETFAVLAEPNDVPARIAERFDGLLDRATLQLPSAAEPRTSRSPAS